MLFLVATSVDASRPPERQPTGMPHACANYLKYTDLHNPLLYAKQERKITLGMIIQNWVK